jgi:hypothetical protein
MSELTTRRKLLFTFILFGLMLFIALMGAEIFIRLTSPYGYVTPETLKAAIPDYQPAVFARHVIRQHAQTAIVNGVVQFRINSHGYRGAEFTDTKPEGVTRIMFYGGSSVFDQESRKEDDWPHRVERNLKARGFTNVEVINAGIPGYASADAVGTFFSEGHLFRPDYVLLSDEWNDIKLFRSSQSLLREFSRGDIQDDPRTTYQNGLDRVLSNVSQLYVRLRSRYYTWKLKIGAEGMRPSGDYSSTFNEAALTQYKLNLETFVDIARNIGAVPILMVEGRLVTPDNSEADKRRISYDYVLLTHEALCRAFTRQDEIIYEVAKAKGVQVINPSSLLNGKSDLFANHIHLNDQGSEVLGEFVAVELAHVLQTQGQHAAEGSEDGITTIGAK